MFTREVQLTALSLGCKGTSVRELIRAMESLVSFRHEVHANPVVNVYENHELSDYFNSLLHMMFNSSVNLHLSRTSPIPGYIDELRARLAEQLGEERMNMANEVFDRELGEWLREVNERVATGENFIELVEHELPEVGKRIARALYDVALRGRL